MGVDFYSCHYCEETFPDCGSYVSCKCGNYWCSMECAEEEGFVQPHCKLHPELDDEELIDEYAAKHCNRKYCSDDCENYVASSCKFCREEDYEDYKLLEKALKLLDMSREELIEKMK